jgi:HK97 family phage major capsid protein
MSKKRILQDEAAALIAELDTLRSFSSDDAAEVASVEERISAASARGDQVQAELAREHELDAKLQSLRTAVANDSDSRSVIEPVNSKEPVVNVRHFENHAQALTAGSFLRSIARGELRNHMKETDTGNGKELVPVELYGNIVNQMTRQSVALRVASVFNTISNKIVLPKVGDSTAAFYNEATCGNLTGIDTTGVELTLYGLRSLTAVSNDLVEDSVVDVASMFSSNVSNAFAAKIDYAWLQGDVTADIDGLVSKLINNGDHIVENAATTTAAKLAAVVAKIDPLASNTAWVVSPAGYGALLEAHGNMQSAVLSDAMMPQVFGRPVYVTTGLPTGVLALYGDFSMSTAVGLRASGLRVEALREVQAIDDRVVFTAKQRVGISNHAEQYAAALVVNGY